MYATTYMYSQTSHQLWALFLSLSLTHTHPPSGSRTEFCKGGNDRVETVLN